MKNTLTVLFALAFTIAGGNMYAQYGILDDIDFGGSGESEDLQIDVYDYISDVTDQFSSMDEKFAEDSATLYENYTEKKKEILQDLITKVTADCYDKNEVLNLKAGSFTSITTNAMSPMLRDLRTMNTTRRTNKETTYAEIEKTAREKLAEMAKDKAGAPNNYAWIVKLVNAKIIEVKNGIATQYVNCGARINKLQADENLQNTGLKNSLDAVAFSKVGHEDCYKIQKVSAEERAARISAEIKAGSEVKVSPMYGADGSPSYSSGSSSSSSSETPSTESSSDTPAADFGGFTDETGLYFPYVDDKGGYYDNVGEYKIHEKKPDE